MQTLPLGPKNDPCVHALSAATNTMRVYACGTALVRAGDDAAPTTVIWIEHGRTLTSLIPHNCAYTIVPGYGPVELDVLSGVSSIEMFSTFAGWIRTDDTESRLFIAATSTNLPSHLRDKYTAGLCDRDGFLRHPQMCSSAFLVWTITLSAGTTRQRILQIAATRDTIVPASMVSHENTLTEVRYDNDTVGPVARVRKRNLRRGSADNVTIPLCNSGKDGLGGSAGVFANPDGDIIARAGADTGAPTYTIVTENNVGLTREYDEYRKLRQYARVGMSIRDLCDQRNHDEITLLTGDSREFIARVEAHTSAGTITYESRPRS